MDDAIPSRGGGFVAAEGLGEAAVAGDCGGVVVAEGGYGRNMMGRNTPAPVRNLSAGRGGS